MKKVRSPRTCFGNFVRSSTASSGYSSRHLSRTSPYVFIFRYSHSNCVAGVEVVIRLRVSLKNGWCSSTSHSQMIPYTPTSVILASRR